MTEQLTMGKLVEMIGQLERRILDLEANSHPPVDLTPFIEREVEEQIARKFLL